MPLGQLFSAVFCQTHTFSVKLIVERRAQKAQGCVIIGNGAAEVINLAALAIQSEVTPRELTRLFLVHPGVLSPKYEVFCCDQNGPPVRREEGAYLNRYVTDEQRSRRPIFIATLWAGAS